MPTKPQRPLRQQANQKGVTSFDLNRVQSNISKTLADIQTAQSKTSSVVNAAQIALSKNIADVQAATLQFIDTEPATSDVTGTPLQAWLGADGTLKICVAKDTWMKFTGVAF